MDKLIDFSAEQYFAGLHLRTGPKALGLPCKLPARCPHLGGFFLVAGGRAGLSQAILPFPGWKQFDVAARDIDERHGSFWRINNQATYRARGEQHIEQAFTTIEIGATDATLRKALAQFFFRLRCPETLF